MILGYMSKKDLMNAKETIRISDGLLINGKPIPNLSTLTPETIAQLKTDYGYRLYKLNNNTHGNRHYISTYNNILISKSMVSDYFYFTHVLKTLLLFHSVCGNSRITLTEDHQRIIDEYGIDNEAYLGFLIINNQSPVLPNGDTLPVFKENLQHYKTIGMRFNNKIDRSRFSAWKEVRRKSTINNVKLYITSLYESNLITKDEMEKNINTLNKLINNYRSYYIKIEIISILLNVHPGIETADKVTLLYLLSESGSKVKYALIKNKKELENV